MSLRLAITKNDLAVDTYSFDQERVLIGRNEDCDVTLDSPGISRHHCEIVLEEGFHRISDLGSSSGTFVNGRRVINGSLSSGDVITVGSFQVAYSSSVASDARPAAPRQQGMGLPTIDAAIDGAAAGGQAVYRPRAHLILHTPSRNKTILLQATTFVVGKASNAQLKLSGWRAPRVAALILRDRGGFRVWDISPKGKAVRVNGKLIRDAELNHGDELVIREHHLHFYKGLPSLDDTTDVREQREVLRQSGKQSRQSDRQG